MVGAVFMTRPSVRKVLLGALLLALAGCAPGPYERGGNLQGLSQRDVERDYMECEYKARLANENQFYNQSTPFPFGPGPPKPERPRSRTAWNIKHQRDEGYLSRS